MVKKYRKGERVQIVGGSFKSHGFGTYIRPLGTMNMRAAVKVDGDEAKQERHLWLTSIALIQAEDAMKSEAPSSRSSITIDRKLYHEILQDVESLSKDVERLQQRLKDMNI
jgi:hypothetical protein